MNIIIIGAKGMLGSMLVTVMKDLKPIAWDKNEIDITDFADVSDKIAREKPDVVINVAAYTDVDGAEEDGRQAMAVNAEGVKNVAAAAKEAGSILVHFSTDYVFSGKNKAGYKEGDETGPAVNVYGESKLAGERYLIEINPDFYLIRIAWLYGPGGKNFVNTMLKLSEEKDALSIVNDQYGNPTFTGDVAFAVRRLIEEKKPYGIYHAVNSGTTTWFEFAKKIFEIAGRQVDVVPVSSAEFVRPAKRPSFSILQNTKDLHMRPWEEALEDYIKNYYEK